MLKIQLCIMLSAAFRLDDSYLLAGKGMMASYMVPLDKRCVNLLVTLATRATSTLVIVVKPAAL